MTPLVELAIKVSVLIGAALAATAALRHRSAALRHWCLAAAMAAALVLPVAQSLMPAWRVLPLAAQDADVSSESTSVTTEIRLPNQQNAAAVNQAPAPVATSPNAWLRSTRAVVAVTGLWAIGAAVSLLILLTGLARLAWIRRESRAFDHPMWREVLADVSRCYGIAQTIEIRTVDHPGFLFTWGVRRPLVLLPKDAADWSIDRARIVLAHELAHIARGDWAIQLIAEALRAANWFNPIVWIACQRLRAESEHACDDAVIASGVAGTDYATELVELARSLAAKRAQWIPAPAMARPSSLEGRITAMLNTNLNRRPIARSTRLAIAGALAAAIAVLGSATVRAQTYSTYAGTVVDQTGGLIPGGTLQLVNEQSGAKYEIKTSSSGTFEFVGLPSGDYTFTPLVPGFRLTPSKITIAGRNVRGELKLQVGTLEETITVTDGGAIDPDSAKEWARIQEKARASMERLQSDLAQVACRPSALGGAIKQPTKVADKRPIYPESLRGTKTAGVVKLDALIAPDGRVREAKVSQSTQPAFDQAAIDAVLGWVYTPTLLNCSPIEVGMTVTVRFSAE